MWFIWKFLIMKKTIKIVVWFFLLSIIMENISFIYVQADDIDETLDSEIVNLSNNEEPDLNSWENITPQENESDKNKIIPINDNEELDSLENIAAQRSELDNESENNEEIQPNLSSWENTPTEENEQNNDSLANGEIQPNLSLWENTPVEENEPSDNEKDSGIDNEEEILPEKTTNQVEIEEDFSLSPKLRWVPMMKSSQTSQYGIIRIKDPNHPWKWITIHDRNLWASATWAGVDESRDSFGYYFQWWNNYWFPSDPSVNISTTSSKVDASNYWPENPYFSDVFVVWNRDWSSIHNDNLRWWSWDSKISNGRWFPITNAEDRRWPCPENYHVPSIGEWSKLLELWGMEYGEVYLSRDGNGLYKFWDNNQEATNEFYSRFFIPKAWWRDNSTTIKDSNTLLLFWTSSPSGVDDAFRLYWDSNRINGQNINKRGYALPIRCFYNSDWLPIKITYDVNWWYRADDEINQVKVVTYTKWDDDSEYEWDITLWTVKRYNNCWESGDKKCMFGWWYTLTGDEIWTWNISEDITLIAKWLEFDDRDISYSGVDFTVMDRNLWAENSWTWDNTYGYYFTWWEEESLCPEWYHIPSTWEWIWIKNLLGSDFNWNIVKNLFNLPFAGKMINNEVVEDEEIGYYLAKDWDETKYVKISESDMVIENISEWEKVSARCFKDYNVWTIKFNTNGWNEIDDITAVNRWEEWENFQVPERSNSIFSWWYTTSNFQEWTKLEKNINYKNEEEINLYAKRECEEWYQEWDDSCDAIYFSISWIDGDENIIKTDSVRRWEIPVYNGNTPTKSPTTNYKYIFNGEWLPEIVAAYENTWYTAQFNEEIIKKSGWSSGWGSKWGYSENIISNDGEKNIDMNISSWMNVNDFEWVRENSLKENFQNNSIPRYSEIQETSTLLLKYSQEFIDAYNFAYQNWITTKTSIYDAKMYTPLTRIQMAKMLSNYAINVLWKEPNLSKWTVKFEDVSNKLDKEYNNAVTLAYQLWIMWQNIKNNKFRPYDEVTRAEFATALSRLLYWTIDWKEKYYEPHISKLYNEWTIKTTNPATKEKRWYVMIMLNRGSTKK